MVFSASSNEKQQLRVRVQRQLGELDHFLAPCELPSCKAAKRPQHEDQRPNKGCQRKDEPAYDAYQEWKRKRTRRRSHLQKGGFARGAQAQEETNNLWGLQAELEVLWGVIGKLVLRCIFSLHHLL